MVRKLLVRLAAILFGVVLFAVAGELVCRLIFSYVVDYDVEMWRYARELKISGLTPGLRFEHRPGSSAELMGVEVQINSDGLRNPEVSKKKPSGVTRVAVLGDSVTFGWGVPQDKTYPVRLQEILRARKNPGDDASAVEVLNFGVGNYTSVDVAAMLERKVPDYSPDLVIYGAFINDAEQPRRIVESSSLLRHSLAAVLVWGRLDRVWRQLGLRENYLDYYRGLYSEEGEGRRQVRSSIEKMRDISRKMGVPLLVVLLPELHDPSGKQFTEVRAFYRDLADALDVRFVDLHGRLSAEGAPSYWVSDDDAHPNAEACSIYAREIARQLPGLAGP